MPLVVPEKKALILHMRNPVKVTSVIPKHQIVEEDGVEYLAVPHNVDTWHILKNLGVKVDTFEPMRWYYGYPKLYGKYEPFKHQSETAVFCTTYKRCYILNEMRTGKSASVLWAGDYLRKAGQVKKTLILCTMSCMDVVWKQAIFGLFPDKSVAILFGDHQRRLQLLRMNYDYYILNHDGLKVGYGEKKVTGLHAEILRMVKDGTINLIIMDEGSEFRNSRTDKWKALNNISKLCPRVWWLTGTPTPGGPEDAWAQARIVNPRLAPEYFTTWRDRVMYKLTPYKWARKSGYEAAVFDMLQPAIRYTKKDVLDLPPLMYSDRAAELTAEQQKLYSSIKREGTVKSSDGSITAVNAAVMVGKMLQISLGAVKNDNGEAVLCTPTNRLQVLEEIIEQAGSKVIIFAPYKAVVDLLVAHLSKKWSVVSIDGRVTGNKRTEALRAFQGSTDPHLLVAHPKTTGHGLELSVADTVVWFGPTYSVDIYEQANHRIMSGLQTKSMGVYHIGCTPLEWKIYEGLKAGVDMQKNILKLYEEEVLGKQLTGELTSVIL